MHIYTQHYSCAAKRSAHYSLLVQCTVHYKRLSPGSRQEAASSRRQEAGERRREGRAHLDRVEGRLVEEADAGHEAQPEVHARVRELREARQVAAHVQLAARRVHPQVLERVRALQLCERTTTTVGVLRTSISLLVRVRVRATVRVVLVQYVAAATDAHKCIRLADTETSRQKRRMRAKLRRKERRGEVRLSARTTVTATHAREEEKRRSTRRAKTAPVHWNVHRHISI